MVSNGYAATHIMFSNEKAVVLVQGQAGDLDAPNLYAAMNVNPIDSGAVLKKQITFSNSSKQTLFDLSCSLSKTVANYGSCTLQINRVDGMVFDPNKPEVIVAVQDLTDIVKASSLFSRPDMQTGIIYFSSDRHLGFSLDYNGGGHPELFMIQYN